MVLSESESILDSLLGLIYAPKSQYRYRCIEYMQNKVDVSGSNKLMCLIQIFNQYINFV